MVKQGKKDIFPLWDIEMAGEFRKKVPVVRKNDKPVKAPSQRVNLSDKAIKNNIIDVPHKPCAYCGKIFYKKVTESVVYWEKKESCSRACGSKFRSVKKLSRDHVEIESPILPVPKETASKTCVICGTIFYRKKWHTDERWEKLATCPDKSCIGKYAKSCVNRSGPIAKIFQPKECVVCGKIFPKPYSQGHAEFEKRPTCSNPCAGKLLSQKAAAEDDSEPDTIAISPMIKMSELITSIPEIVLVELQDYAVKNNVSTSDVALVAMIEFLLAVKPDNRTIKTTIRSLFKKEPEAKPKW